MMDNNPQTQTEFFNCCQGHTHMPWCSEYEESGRESDHRNEAAAGHNEIAGQCRQFWERYDHPLEHEEPEAWISHFDSYHRKGQACNQCASHISAGGRLEAQAKQMAELVGENERLRALLQSAMSPTHCYCDVMDGKKCWQCKVRAALNHAARGEGK